MTDVSALTDLPTPINGDFVLSWRGTAPYRMNISQFVRYNAAINAAKLSDLGGAISCDNDGAAYYGGSSFYSGNFRNTTTGQGGWAIRNSSGVFTIFTGSNPGAAGSAFSDMGERLRIDAAGNVMIGGASSSYKFTVTGPAIGGAIGNKSLVNSTSVIVDGNTCVLSTTVERFAVGSGWTNTSTILRHTVDSTQQGYVEWNGQGNQHGVSLCSIAGNKFQVLATGNLFADYASATAFLIKKGGADVANFDASGNFNLGTTNIVSLNVDGAIEIQRASGSAYIDLKASGDYDTRLQSIGSGSSAIFGVSLLTSGLRFVVENGAIRSAVDNGMTNGAASARWSTVYAATGTINTSDERDKAWRGSLSEAELKAARLIAKEIGVYRWLASIEEKGDFARFHIGVKAQSVFKIIEDQGLDWKAYAWCCYDEWEDIVEEQFEKVTEVKKEIVNYIDEENEEIKQKIVEVEHKKLESKGFKVVNPAGNRYGVRPDQLALFLIAAQEQRLEALEARLDDGK